MGEIDEMKNTALLVMLMLVLTAILPISASAEEDNSDEYNEFGIKWGTEVYGIDISKFSEEELQYVPEGWRDGVIEDTHPEATEDEDATLQASYPNVNQYIKDRGYNVANTEYSHISHLPKFGYRKGIGKVEGVVAHETANNNSKITGEIQYMSRNYMDAFVHAFVDDNRVIEVHPTDYAAWGAGPVANQRFIHVELVRVDSFDRFARSINNYADYIASLLFKYNLGVTDAERTGVGTLWSHKAVTNHLGGTNHVDPHGYFSRYGYTWNEFVTLVQERYQSYAYTLPRVSGTNRYLTAVEVSKKGWRSASAVVLARGDDYSDALAGVPLAKKYNAPLLMTQSTRLTDATKKELQRLGAKTVYVLGGSKAINETVVTQLKQLGITVERIAGNNRIETAAVIANRILAGTSQRQVALVDGYNYADALAVAPYAAEKGMPILLTQSNSLSTETKAIFQNYTISKTYVIGGKKAVADKVITGLPSVTRISGRDRYATAVELAKTFKPTAKDFYVTTGKDFPDSLAAASLAAKENKGLLLVYGLVPPQVKDHIVKQKISNLSIIGGTTAVSKTVERELKQLINLVI